MNKIQPAKRVNSINEYYFSNKLEEIAAMNAAGLNVINLGIANPDMPPSEETIRTLYENAIKDNMHGYQQYTGIPELRDAFSDWYYRWYGVQLDTEGEILPLIGSKEGILYVSLAFLNPGDGVLVPNPGYPAYSSVSELLQAKIYSYDLNESNNWEPDFEDLETRDLANIKLMWVNYPNMPTGAPGSKSLFERLVAFGKKHNIIICHDNPYSFILNKKPLSILQVKDAKNICIELNSMSKSHNMAGWRMGVLASNPEFVNWILKVKSNVDSGQFKPFQLAAVSALKNSERWHERMNIQLYENRRWYAEKIFHQLECTFNKNQEGMFLWGKIPSIYKNGQQLTDKILQRAHVFITPGIVFGSNGEQYVRISLCCNENMFEVALERIKSVLEKK